MPTAASPTLMANYSALAADGAVTSSIYEVAGIVFAKVRDRQNGASRIMNGEEHGMTERQDTLTKYVSDMLALTKHIHEAIERQLDDDGLKKTPDAVRVIRTLDGILEMQINTLEAHLKSIGGAIGSPVKDVVSSALGMFAGLLDMVRTDTVSKMLRDDYTALSLQAIALTMLHTTGLALNKQSTADLALSQLHDITPLIVEISEIIPLVVVRELADDTELIDANVGTLAVNNTQKAWSREATQA
jgi:hypothetical protein